VTGEILQDVAAVMLLQDVAAVMYDLGILAAADEGLQPREIIA